MHTAHIGDLLVNRFAATHNHRHVFTNAGSIEPTEDELRTNSTSIELPEEISSLITGSAYWQRAKANRYKKLIREGHLHNLLKLAAEARTKENPANWFATACSKARWETQTIPYLAKLAKVAALADRVARRLRTPVSRFIYQQIWRGVSVERWAIAAEEVRHDKPGQSRERYFAWLCAHEKQLVS